jgi:Transglycosylase-like domain
MALRSLLQIDVNDDQFKTFHQAFSKYQAELSKLPAGWQSTNAAVAETAVTMEGLTALMLAQNEHMASLLKAQGAFGAATRSSVHYMGSLQRAAHGVAHAIGTATRELLKWGSITSAVSGVLGLGGLWGLEDLASVATSGRRQAMGLGTSYGGPQAFGVEYSPLLSDPNALLNSILTARTDPRSAQFRAMLALGYSPGGLAGTDTTMLAAGAVDRIQKWAQQFRNNPLMLGPMSEATGISSLVDRQTLVGLASRNPVEVAEAQERLRRLWQQAQVQDKLLKQWQDLNVTLGESRLKIESAFIVGLTDLAGPLKHLSVAFGDAVAAFLHSAAFKKWIDLAAGALERFAKYMSDPQFEMDVEYVANVLWNFGKVVWRVTQWIAGLFKDNEGSPGNTGPTDMLRAMANSWSFAEWWGGGKGVLRSQRYSQWWDPQWGGLAEPGAIAKGIHAARDWLINKVMSTRGMFAVPPALPARWLSGEGIDPLSLIEKYESGGRNVRNQQGSPASGYWQIMPQTWARYASMVPGASQYNEAIGAPEAIQRAVAQAIYNNEGFSPWESYDTPLKAAVDMLSTAGPRQQVGMNQAQDGLRRVASAANQAASALQHIAMNQPSQHMAANNRVRIIVENRTGGSAHIAQAMLGQVA